MEINNQSEALDPNAELLRRRSKIQLDYAELIQRRVDRERRIQKWMGPFYWICSAVRMAMLAFAGGELISVPFREHHEHSNAYELPHVISHAYAHQEHEIVPQIETRWDDSWTTNIRSMGCSRINPATGYPMIGMIDAGGNPYGFSYDDDRPHSLDLTDNSFI